MKVFFEQMREAGCDIRCLGRAKIAAIGSGTKKALEERGLFVDLMPEIYDGEALGIALSRQVQAGERVLIPRASRGNQSLIESLKTVGAKVDDVPTYDTHYARSKIIQEVDEFENGKIQCAVFTSASTVKGFVEGTPGLDYAKVRAACIGKQTKAAADAYGMKTYMAKQATMDSLVDLVIQMKEGKKDGDDETSPAIEGK